VLKKQDLTDTVIVVTRYFGGVKLGAGGLIRAYGKAASEAVRAAGTVEMQPHLRVDVSCDYSLLAMLENHLRNHGYTVTDKTFTERATIYVLRRPDDTGFEQQIADWTSGLATIREAGEEYVVVDQPSPAL
jgi:putative IMPACT (imprinted ancient) family translation regulator